MVKTEKKGTQYGNRSGGNQGWKPPTSDLTDVTFDYGTRMNTGDFKRNVSLIAGKVAEKIKHGSKDIVRACNTGIAPVADEPSDPGPDATAKDLSTFNYKHSKYLREADQWEENNSKLYIRFMQHCSPSMETKLQSMVGYETMQNDLDGLELVKMLRKAYFEQDGTKQAILEIVEADKRLMLCWQKPGMTIDSYTREYKACIEVCEAVGSGIGISAPSTKLACEAVGNDYDTLKASDDVITFKRMEMSGQAMYFAALHFEGLNRKLFFATRIFHPVDIPVEKQDTFKTKVWK